MLGVLPWHRPIVQSLVEQKASGRLAHAILIDAQSNEEALLLARSLPGYLLCDELSNCGNCRFCGFLAQGAHPDMRLLTPEGTSKEIKIEQVRQLLAFGEQTATYPAGKVTVLAPANGLNRNSANSLLKFLEEPPENTFIILVCGGRATLPATVMSRCQLLKVERPSEAQSIDYLCSLGMSDDIARTALDLSGNRPILAAQIEHDGGLDKFRRFIAAADLAFEDGGSLRSLAIAAEGLSSLIVLDCLDSRLHQLVRQRVNAGTETAPLLKWQQHLSVLRNSLLKSPNISIPLALEQVYVSIHS